MSKFRPQNASHHHARQDCEACNAMRERQAEAMRQMRLAADRAGEAIEARRFAEADLARANERIAELEGALNDALNAGEHHDSCRPRHGEPSCECGWREAYRQGRALLDPGEAKPSKAVRDE